MRKHKPLMPPDTLYHVAYARNWNTIRQYGLLTTSEIFRRSHVSSEERALIRIRGRTESCILALGGLCHVTVRDQKPLPPGGLCKALEKSKMTSDAYLDLLDDRVFFWASKARLKKLTDVYEAQPQVVLEVNTAALLEAYRGKIQVAEFNTGNARRKPVDRGPDTFMPLERYQPNPIRKIVEVTVKDAVIKIIDRIAMPNGTQMRILKHAYHLDADQTTITSDG